MKLLAITADKNMNLVELTDTHWVLVSPYYAKFITDEGVYHLHLKEGWVTDKRSGSAIIDPIIPKWSSNYKYQACIAGHDCSYSGWLSKKLADELFIHQGLYKSGEVGMLKSGLAYYSVSAFGNSGYYSMDDNLPYPYYDNRKYESLVLLDN